jgi:uncharacterized protein (DUF983 family)
MEEKNLNEPAFAKLPVSCLICPSCGSSDKYVEFYNEDMICQGCGYDLGRICAQLRIGEQSTTTKNK